MSLIPFLTHLVRCKATPGLAMAPWSASPCPARPRSRAPSPPPPASWGSSPGTAGSLCRRCIPTANVREWNLTQLVKGCSLPAAALCCHTPGRLGEGRGDAARLVTAEHQNLPGGKSPAAEGQPRSQGKPSIEPVNLIAVKSLRSFSRVGIYSCLVAATG